MYIDDEQKQIKRAEETKRKRESIVFGSDPFPCKKCGIKKMPKDFVVHWIDNHWVGKYRYLYECKECKKKRTYDKRSDDRQTIQGAMNVVLKQIKQGAKKRDVVFDIGVQDMLDLWNKQGGKCYYTGYDMAYGFVNYREGKYSDKVKFQVSCDRIDNDMGYKKGNVVLCCTFVNKMKGILSEDEFYKVCKDISKLH